MDITRHRLLNAHAIMLLGAMLAGAPCWAAPTGVAAPTLVKTAQGPALDALVKHLKAVIRDETKRVPDRKLRDFVAKYQRIALNAGVNDIDRQTQNVLLALYTSGKGVEHPASMALMKNPPQSIDAFHAAMDKLPAEIWDTGPPLWEAGPAQQHDRSGK